MNFAQSCQGKPQGIGNESLARIPIRTMRKNNVGLGGKGFEKTFGAIQFEIVLFAPPSVLRDDGKNIRRENGTLDLRVVGGKTG